MHNSVSISMVRCRLYLFLLTIMVSLISANSIAQTIGNQELFDEAMTLVKKGKPVRINLLPGTYHLAEPVIAKASFSITGVGATISSYTDTYGRDDAERETATHYICHLRNMLEEYSMMVDQDGKLVDVAESVNEITHVNHASDIIGTYEKKVGLEVRIPVPANLSHLKNKSFQKAFGYFDCGWSRVCFKLKKSDRMYFYCETLHTINVPRFDYEKSAYGNDIRFVIYNAEEKPNSVYYDNEYIYIPKSISQLSVKNCNVFTGAKPDITIKGDVSITGIKFEGINGISVTSGSVNQCSFIGCSFTHTLGTALSITKKSETDFIPAYVSRCTFEECSLLWDAMLNLSSSYVGGKSIFVGDCKFVRYPDAKVRYKNTSAMVNVNADSRVSNCTFWNTCRCHLYFTNGNSESVGNVIYNTLEFNAPRDRNLSNDWGLIYINHVFKDSDKAKANEKHKVIIDRCFLYGAYAYANDARGVMVDNGRGDVSCGNNIILDCQCYSLDAREAKSFIGTSSIRTVFENNILGSRYRLAGGTELSEQERPISRGNVFLAEYRNVTNEKTLVEDTNRVLPIDIDWKDGKMYVKRSGYRRLKKISFFKQVEPYVKNR